MDHRLRTPTLNDPRGAIFYKHSMDAKNSAKQTRNVYRIRSQHVHIHGVRVEFVTYVTLMGKVFLWNLRRVFTVLTWSFYTRMILVVNSSL